MLFKVSHAARHADGSTITLHPQFEANDEAHAREKHAQWLENTGYSLVLAAEQTIEEVAAALVFELLSDEGFDPDVQEVQSLELQVVDLKAKLAAAGDAPAQVADLTAKLKAATDAPRTSMPGASPT